MTSPRHRKRQHANHITGKLGVDLVKQRLPEYWAIRELNPDYGLDIHVEVFDLLPDGSGSADTLGEHFYAQVKGVKGGVEKIIKTVRSRTNVAKADPDPNEGDEVDIEVVAFSLDTNELLTVEAMGAAVPALLFVADLDTGTVYYVCLSDYISKVLLPENPNYADQGSHTIYLPTWNVLDPADDGFAYMWLLARRSKYYAAFNTFIYQRIEMGSAVASFAARLIDPDTDKAQLAPDIISMLRVFVRADLRLDIWEQSGPGSWSPLNDVRDGLEKVLKRIPLFTKSQPTEAVERFCILIDTVLRQGANLGRMYEELVREWRLPTAFAVLFDDSPTSKYRPIDRRKAAKET